MTVDCTVTSRFAHTVMTSVALNKANVSQEIFFKVELPKTAFITNFSMSVFLQNSVFNAVKQDKIIIKSQHLSTKYCVMKHVPPSLPREIEGQVYVGEVKEKEKAKKQYEKAVSSGQTAGLVKLVGQLQNASISEKGTWEFQATIIE